MDRYNNMYTDDSDCETYYDKIDAVEDAKMRYKMQSEVAKQQKYLESLALNEYVRCVRQIKNKYDCIHDVLIKAFNEQSNKKASEKKSFSMMQSLIQNDFFKGDKTAKITSIVRCGYDGYAYQFKIHYGLCDIALQLPNCKEITVDNIEYAYYGKIVVYVEEYKNCLKAIHASYSIKEIADAVEKIANFEI